VAAAALQKAGRLGGGKPGQGGGEPGSDPSEEPDPARAELSSRKRLVGQAYVDALAEKGQRRAVKALGPALRAAAAEVEHVSDFDSLRERLETLAGRLSPDALGEELEQHLVLAELAGRYAVLLEMGEQDTEALADKGATTAITANPAHFEEAVKAWRKRVPIADEDYRQLTEAARARAFTVAGVADLQVLDQAWAALEDAVAKGETYADFKAKVGPALEAAWGGEQPHLLETVYRTNVQTAYAAGRYQVLNDPAVLRRRPYRKFSAINDSRTSPICSPLAGTILPANDPWWATHHPPLHQRCRSTEIALTADQAEAAGVATEPPAVEPADGFGAPPDLSDWKPDLSRYPAPLVAAWRRSHETT